MAANTSYDIVPEAWVTSDGSAPCAAAGTGQSVFIFPSNTGATAPLSSVARGILAKRNFLPQETRVPLDESCTRVIVVTRDTAKPPGLLFSADVPTLRWMRSLGWAEFEAMQRCFVHRLLAASEPKIFGGVFKLSRERFNQQPSATPGLTVFDACLRDLWANVLAESTYAKVVSSHKHFESLVKAAPDPSMTVPEDKPEIFGANMGSIELRPGMRLCVEWGTTANYGFAELPEFFYHRPSSGGTSQLEIVQEETGLALGTLSDFVATPVMGNEFPKNADGPEGAESPTPEAGAATAAPASPSAIAKARSDAAKAAEHARRAERAAEMSGTPANKNLALAARQWADTMAAAVETLERMAAATEEVQPAEPLAGWTPPPVSDLRTLPLGTRASLDNPNTKELLPVYAPLDLCLQRIQNVQKKLPARLTLFVPAHYTRADMVKNKPQNAKRVHPTLVRSDYAGGENEGQRGAILRSLSRQYLLWGSDGNWPQMPRLQETDTWEYPMMAFMNQTSVNVEIAVCTNGQKEWVSLGTALNGYLAVRCRSLFASQHETKAGSKGVPLLTLTRTAGDLSPGKAMARTYRYWTLPQTNLGSIVLHPGDSIQTPP